MDARIKKKLCVSDETEAVVLLLHDGRKEQNFIQLADSSLD